MNLSDRLNLSLAWKRVKDDIKENGQSFIDHPLELELIEYDLSNYLENLKDNIKNNNYNPSRNRIIDIPKPNWHIRPGSILNIPDQIIFSALILECIGKIRDDIAWSTNKKRFSNLLKEDQSGKKWIEFKLDAWNNFREKSLEILKNGYNYVLFTDISAFFENIEIKRLIYDLDCLNVSKDNLDQLSKCLNRWAEPNERGIPQGSMPSNILAEVFLNSIDKRLEQENIVHLRWVDDTRIFCENKEQAIENLHILSRLYRQKGLNLQTAKSYIKEKKISKEIISGKSKIITKLRGKIIKEFQEKYNIENSSSSPSEIRYYMRIYEKKVDLHLLRKAFKQFFQSKDSIEFDKSLFHFIINRLGALENEYAMEYCLELILDKPEETLFILDYFSSLKDYFPYIGKHLIDYVKNHLLHYEYQIFLIIKWIWKRKVNSEYILDILRNLIKNPNLLSFTKDYCFIILGFFGDTKDLDLIETFYENTKEPISKATIIYSLKNMPKSRRNSIYGRAHGDGYLVNLAIKNIRSKT